MEFTVVKLIVKVMLANQRDQTHTYEARGLSSVDEILNWASPINRRVADLLEGKPAALSHPDIGYNPHYVVAVQVETIGPEAIVIAVTELFRGPDGAATP